MSEKLNNPRTQEELCAELAADVIDLDTAMALARGALDRFETDYRHMQEDPDDSGEMPLMEWVEGWREALMDLETPDQMPEVTQYTVFAMDPDGNQAGDALLVAGHHVDAAIKALETAHEVEGLHFELHRDSVRDSNGWRPLPWLPGQAVTDPETEAARQNHVTE